MVIDARGGEGSSRAAPKKTFMDHFYATFSSPIAWVLVLALVITWSCVFVIIFDMMDYKTLSGPPPAVRKTLKDTERRGGLTKLGSDPMKAVNDAVEGSSSVLTSIFSFAANLIAPDEDEALKAHDMPPGECSGSTIPFFAGAAGLPPSSPRRSCGSQEEEMAEKRIVLPGLCCPTAAELLPPKLRRKQLPLKLWLQSGSSGGGSSAAVRVLSSQSKIPFSSMSQFNMD
ncbi:unnamed protein product [Boreogadus saida]